MSRTLSGSTRRLLRGAGLAALFVLSTPVHAVTLYDGAGSEYDIHDTAGYLIDGGPDAYDGMYKLRVNGNGYSGSVAGQSTDGREIRFTAFSESSSGLEVSRNVYVPTTGNFARYTEILTNPTSSDVTVSVEVWGDLGSDSATVTLDSSDSYLITDDRDAGAGGGDPTLLHYHSAVGSGQPATVTLVNNDDLSWSWPTLNVPAGGTVRLLYFVAQSDDLIAAQLVRAQIEANGVELYENMSGDEMAQVVNFTPPSSTTPTGGFASALPLAVPQSLTGSLDSGDAGSIQRSGLADLYAIDLSAGQEVTISMAASFDTYLYLYDVAGSEVARNDDGGVGLNSEIVYTAATAGVYYIEATAYSSGLGIYTLDVIGAATNQEPVASFSIDTATHQAPATVRFSDFSFDSDGTISQACWDFGDGAGAVCGGAGDTTHDYLSAGNYLVTLTVVDDDGASAQSSQTLTVESASVGEVMLSVPDSASGELASTDSLSLIRTSSYADLYRISLAADQSITIDLVSSDFDTYLYLYDTAFEQLRRNDDGGAGLNSRITYTAGQSEDVIIEATSYSGGRTGAYTLTISSDGEVLPTTLSIDTTPSPSNPLMQTYLARLSGEFSLERIEWNMGDGGAPFSTAGTTVTYAYADEGSYVVTATAYASSGTTVSGSTTVNVDAAVETVTAEFLTNVTSGSAPLDVAFTDQSSSSLGGDQFTYLWEFGDGQVSTERHPTHTFTDAGVYDVVLTVTSESSQQSGSYAVTVTVESAAVLDEVAVTGITRLRPQVIMAGVDPMQIDLVDTSFKVFAIVRPGATPIQQVQMAQNAALFPTAMNHVATYGNGDQRHEVRLTFPRGSFPEGSLGDLFGDQEGEFNIQVVDLAQQEHAFPYLEFGNNPMLNLDITSPYLPPSTQPGVRRLTPQVLAVGFDPTLIDLSDTSFEIKALVREGVVAMQNVTVNQNGNLGFALAMNCNEAHPNGDTLCSSTFTFPRGSFPASELGYLFGSNPGEFHVQAVDRAQQSHSFPYLEFGNYPAQ